MEYNPAKHHRQSIRLRGWNYAQPAAYFVTVCIQDRKEPLTGFRTCLLGNVLHGETQLNELGNIVWDEWFRTPDVRREIALDAFMVMPNHIHGVVWIRGGDPGRGIRPDAPTTTTSVAPAFTPTLPITIKHGPVNRSLGAFMAGFKSITTRRINELRNTPGVRVWQRNYHDWIIRDDSALNRIRRYIADNPAQWEWDAER